jgi:hypothetical protein
MGVGGRISKGDGGVFSKIDNRLSKTEYHRPYLPYLYKLGCGGVPYSYCMKLIRARAIPCKML